MARVATNRVQTVLLLHGEERFLIVEAARSTLEAWKQDLVSDFGFETLEGTGLTPTRLQDYTLQAPFLDPSPPARRRLPPPCQKFHPPPAYSSPSPDGSAPATSS